MHLSTNTILSLGLIIGGSAISATIAFAIFLRNGIENNDNTSYTAAEIAGGSALSLGGIGVALCKKACRLANNPQSAALEPNRPPLTNAYAKI